MGQEGCRCIPFTVSLYHYFSRGFENRWNGLGLLDLTTSDLCSSSCTLGVLLRKHSKESSKVNRFAATPEVLEALVTQFQSIQNGHVNSEVRMLGFSVCLVSLFRLFTLPKNSSPAFDLDLDPGADHVDRGPSADPCCGCGFRSSSRCNT